MALNGIESVETPSLSCSWVHGNIRRNVLNCTFQGRVLKEISAKICSYKRIEKELKLLLRSENTGALN